MSVTKYHISKYGVGQNNIDSDAVGRDQLGCIKFGTASVDAPSINPKSVGSATVAASGVETTDKILALMQETPDAKVVLSGAAVETAGVITLYFSNPSDTTTNVGAKEIVWARMVMS